MGDFMKKIVVLLLILLSACTNLSQKEKILKDKDEKIISFDKDKDREKSLLYDFYTDYKGVPYRLGGTDKTGIDCSGFVQRAFSEVFLVSLPRTTQTQMKYGKNIEYSERNMGDLIFFKTGVNTYHVGIYYENDNFIHASTSKGVMISNLNEFYWLNSLLEIRRIIR